MPKFVTLGAMGAEKLQKQKCKEFCGTPCICKNIPFEVGSRGHLTLPNKSKIAMMHELCKPKTKYKHFYQDVSKTSLLCFYSIFLSRLDEWNSPQYLSPVKHLGQKNS